METSEVEPGKEGEEVNDPQTVYNIAVEPLPFTEVSVEDPEKLLRTWIFKEIHGIEVPLTQSTLDYMEKAFQWIQSGKLEKPLRAVK
jgi:hypothetical protein